MADLWVPHSSALYIPPKPAMANAVCIDLHNNRNSAHACWGDIRPGHDQVTTKTLLQKEWVFLLVLEFLAYGASAFDDKELKQT